jgi:Ca2+-binding EF-hand superfamily protein
MKKTILLLLAAAAWAGDDDAAQADAAAKAKSTLKKLDADGDGKISKDEFIGSASIFERWDADKDGFVTEAELAAGLAAPKPKAQPQRDDRPGRGPADAERLRRQVDGVLQRLDKDKDGKLTGEEIPKRGDWMRMDANADGAIDADELAAGFRARGGGRPRGPDLAQRLLAMDTDKDGRISKEEWKGRPEGFARMDTDQDGFLTKSEIEEIAKRMRRRGGWKSGPSDALFRRMDADQDGKLTKEEWKLKPDLFARFDANGDGVITPDEVMPADPRQPGAEGDGSAEFLRRFDRNGDGKIEASEFKDERRFAAMDRDQDGVLSKTEIEQALDKQDRERGMGFLERFDRDRDGKVTREEFTGPAKLFDRMDRNKDGVIDAADKAK